MYTITIVILCQEQNKKRNTAADNVPF